MAVRGDVVWASDPFKPAQGNPRPWLIVSTDRLPYANEESIGVAFTTRFHHPGSLAIPREAWIRGEPRQPSHVLPWTIATLKDGFHIVGKQGAVVDAFTDRVVAAAISYLDGADMAGSPT